MQITTVGIDLAKNVFQVHGVDSRGGGCSSQEAQARPRCGLFANLPRCVVGMEACASAHHWARKLIDMGHDVRLIARGSLSRSFVGRRDALCETFGGIQDAQGDLCDTSARY